MGRGVGGGGGRGGVTKPEIQLEHVNIGTEQTQT